MAANQKGFPRMPAKSWWALREKFKKTIPTTVDATYVASALDVTERSAQNNILPALRTTQLIDEDGKPTDRAVKWRDDGHYADVCEEIRQECYPEGLLDLAPPDNLDRAEIERWFANTAAVGENQAQKLTAFYWLLCDADPSKSTGAGRPQKAAQPKTKKVTKKKAVQKKITPTGGTPAEEEKGEKRSPSRRAPEFNVNVQIHISADATADQIDQIFKSMSTYLKDFI